MTMTIGAATRAAGGKPVPIPITDGANGWSPVLSAEADGTRSLLKVGDWIGGTGTKPAAGYIGTSGIVAAKADAFNFNLVKRVDIFSGVTNAQGVAAITFSPAFAAVPAKVLPSAVPNVLSGPVKAELVANSVTKSGCSVKVTAAALVTGVVAALAGATVSVIAIEG
jgi:hypothetical protein